MSLSGTVVGLLVSILLLGGQGVRNHLPERPGGCCAQMVPDPFLPEGKGIEKVRVHCGLCHGLELVAQQRLNQAQWTRVVDQMVEFGAPLAPGDRREIVEYLTAYLGPME